MIDSPDCFTEFNDGLKEEPDCGLKYHGHDQAGQHACEEIHRLSPFLLMMLERERRACCFLFVVTPPTPLPAPSYSSAVPKPHGIGAQKGDQDAEHPGPVFRSQSHFVRRLCVVRTTADPEHQR